MIASREEAADMLSKWFNERTPVTALLASPGTSFAVKISGFVNGITSNILVSDGDQDPAVRPKNYILVPTDSVTSYQYLEAKELGLSPDETAFVEAMHGAATLSLIFSGGTRLSLFEREP